MARSIPYSMYEYHRALEMLDRVGPCQADVIAQDLFDHYGAMGKNKVAAYWFGVGNALKDIREGQRRRDEVKTKAKRTELKERAKALRSISCSDVKAKVLRPFRTNDVQEIAAPKLDAALEAVNEEIEKRTVRKRKAATAVANELLKRDAYSQLRKVLDSFGVRQACEVPPERVDELIAAYERALGEFEMLNRCKEEAVTHSSAMSEGEFVAGVQSLEKLGYEFVTKRPPMLILRGKTEYFVRDLRTGKKIVSTTIDRGTALKTALRVIESWS